MSDSNATHLYIVGAGGHARELGAYMSDIIRLGWTGELAGYLDDRLPPGTHGGLNVVASIEGFSTLEDSGRDLRYLTALGNNPVRRQVVQRLTELYEAKLKPWVLIHPSAYIGKGIDLGGDVCICPHAVITSGVKIGDHTIVNVKASISHDCRIGRFCNINPSATVCGGVTLGDGVNLGAGATVKEGVTIGAWSVIGAGAVVIRDVPENVTAVGVPAKIVKETGPLPLKNSQ